MALETRNALIRNVQLGVEDHGILTAHITLDYGGVIQSFGGFALDRSPAEGSNKRRGHESCATFVRRTLDTLEISWWENLKGTPCRAKIENGKVIAIGHFIKNLWFEPREELK